jgi:hypothetical protein
LAQAVEGEVGAHGRPAGVDVEGAGMEDLHLLEENLNNEAERRLKRSLKEVKILLGAML